ncbi:hypothetical protein DFH06DRAFT_1165846 [Mycena polygramma]|nr:hypothetical protein DFH06DRAFT_1165846 [Mycena polygramma]
MAPSCWQCGAPPTAPSAPIPVTSSIDLTHLLTSNEGPFDSELPVIRDIVSKGQEEVDAFNSQIATLDAQRARLVGERDQISEHVRQHRAILSTIRRVPPELVGEIFALTLPGEGEDAANLAPWYLGHICRSWRRYALGHSFLWTSITIPSSSSPVEVSLRIETQLLRSATAPLHVRWLSDEDGSIPDSRALAFVLAHSSRWSALSLTVTHYNVNLGWLYAAAGRLLALETLTVVDDKHTFIPDIFSAAPRLRKIFSVTWNYRSYTPHIRFPWSQLTHFRGRITDADSLSAASNMLSCALNFVPGGEFNPMDDDDPDDSPPAPLPRLRRLCVTMPRFLHRIRAPLLEELFAMCVSSIDLPHIVPFIHSSSCSLKNLVITDCYISPELIIVLRALPHLTYLLIEETKILESNLEETFIFEEALFDAMTVTGASGDLCPNLTSLVYGFINPNFLEDLFLTMAQSRFEPTGCLTQLRVFGSRTKSCLDLVQILCDEGFDAAFLRRDEADRLQAKGFFL